MDYSFDGTGGYRIPTGIGGLDVQLGGGVPPGATILILAEPGANSDMFAQQFVYGGLLNNEEVFYFTSEHPAQEIVHEMEDMSWDVEKYVEDGTLEFIDAYLPRFYNVLPKEFTSNLSAKDFLKKGTDSMGLLKTTAVQKREGKYRGVIDSISYFLRAYNLNTVVEVIEMISSIGKATGAIHLVLMTSGMHDSVTENTLRHICDGVIEFRIRERGSEIERNIMIRKMRGMIVPNRTISYMVTQKGIELETTTRVL
ncbi:RAD55 family ATPase [Methanolobus profundi]|uniref:RecA-superfamily ATPase, KaiC/GvpD/RAD55 family n=1 Tax=Methanolobus profundi TaxID=487685 RepID=A0A1I4RAG9_9EURY|nr:ATPase domain-containing protein [Methanolobus profundi]SFM49217.1 RecA-superfamily ATPase, KaiC/GvpD/RAD55 family [Methanolobus profundi]